MTDIPTDPKRIRARIRRYERKLQQERRELGGYHDGAGKRYFIGPLYLLMGDIEGAVRSFQWFDQEFPDDSGDPGQYLCWTLALYRTERLPEAVAKLRETMLQNRFLLPRLLGRNLDGLDVSPDSDELEIMHLDYMPREYLDIWNERELLWASTLYDGEFSTVRARYIEIERELVHEPRGERRTRLVNELFGMKRSNCQDRPD